MHDDAGNMRESWDHKAVVSIAVLQDATHRALAGGALLPIEMRTIQLEDEGVRFIVRVVSNLARKPRPRPAHDRKDPLGQDVDLFVTELGPWHRLLLNKFPVVAGHALIVTRQFEAQEQLLRMEDFAALRSCLENMEGLAFYNGGAEAGASQRRKHLHLIPLTVAPEISDVVPIEAVLTSSLRLPFRYAFARIAPDATASGLRAVYRELLEQCGISGVATEEGEFQSAPYNLLVRRSWMLVVPRLLASFDSISVNALGFAGSLIVGSQGDLERVRAIRPMHLLRAVAMPPIG